MDIETGATTLISSIHQDMVTATDTVMVIALLFAVTTQAIIIQVMDMVTAMAIRGSAKCKTTERFQNVFNNFLAQSTHAS